MNRRRYDLRDSQALCDAAADARGLDGRPVSPLRWYGGLRCHAHKIAELLPPHERYAEPFAGGAAVFFSKPTSETEVLCDVHSELVNFWRVVQRAGLRQRLIERIEMTPHSRAVFEECFSAVRKGGGDSVRRAWAFLVTMNQSMNGRAARKSNWSYNTSRASGNANSWAGLPDRLEHAGRRLQGVEIECLPYEDVLGRFSSPSDVVLLDPPYLSTTRHSPKVYRHEFTPDDHRRLLRLVKRSRARVVICGCASRMYAEALANWTRVEIETRSFAKPCIDGERRNARTLVLWMNFEPPV